MTTNTELNAMAAPAMSGLSSPAAASGMAARFRQAWAGLVANRPAPVIVAVQVAAGEVRLGAEAETRIRATLTQFLDAQPGLPGHEASP